MDAEILLCDHAEAINSKLYINGGGWSVVYLQQPLRCDVALRIATGWTESNTPHDLKLALVDQDGQVVVSGEQGPVVAEGKFEVGRPPGVTHGEDLIDCLVVGWAGLDLAAGMYQFLLEIDAQVIAKAAFRVVRQGEDGS